MADGENLKDRFLKAMGESPSDQPTPTNSNSGAGLKSRFLGAMGEAAPVQSELMPISAAAVDQYTPQESMAAGYLEAASPSAPLGEDRYKSENAEPGVPLDTHSGADALTRLRLGLTRNKIDQLEILRGLYGEENVRLDKSGGFIFRTKDESGKPKDMVVDESRLSAKDLLDLASEYPAFAMSMLTTKGVPAKKVWETALRGAAGYFAGGAATDAASRIAEGKPVEVGEILSDRGPQILSDTIGGGLLGKGIQAIGVMSKLARAAASAQESITDAGKAAALQEVQSGRLNVAKKARVVMEPTVGEITGNPMAQRLEAFLSNIPIARSIVLKSWQRQLDNEKAVQSALLGGKPPDPSRAGDGLQKLLGGEIDASKAQLSKAASELQSETAGLVTGPLEKSAPGPKISPTSFGERMAERGESQLESFKDQYRQMFGEIQAQPDAKLPVFTTKEIKAKANSIRTEELVQKKTSKETGLLDQFGRAGKVEGTAPIKEFAPSGVESILDGVDKLDANATYADLVKVRNSIYDRIDSPEPISSRGTALLKQLGAAVTAQIKEQGKEKLTPKTYAMIQDANQFYADNVDTFYQKGVMEMLRPRTEADAIDPELIASRLVAGGKGSVTAYKTFANFFDPSRSGEAINDMNRLLRDAIVDSGTDKTTGLMKLDSMIQSVATMEPEIVEFLFKEPKEALLKKLHQNMTGLRVGTKGFSIPEPNTQAAVEAEAFKSLLNSGKIESDKLKDMITSRNVFIRDYSNKIKRASATGDTGIIEAQPETFVQDYVLNSNIPIRDVKDAMASVYRSGNMDLAGDIGRVYLADIFRRAAKNSPEVTQNIARLSGSPLRDIDPQKLAIILEDTVERERMNAVLGRSRTELVQDFAKAISGRGARDMTGTTQGAFKGGTVFEQLMSMNFSVLPELAQYTVASYLITHPNTVIATASKLSPKNLDAAIRSAILTPEFFRAVAADATSQKEAYEVSKAVKEWAEREDQK